MRKKNTSKKKNTSQNASPQLSGSEEQQPTTSHNDTVRNNTNKRKSTTPRRKKAYTQMIILGKKFKITEKTIREIRHFQATTNLLIPKLPFARVVKEIFLDHGARDFKIQDVALQALHEATELYMTMFFEDSNLCAMHCKRVTLYPRDMELAKQIRKE